MPLGTESLPLDEFLRRFIEAGDHARIRTVFEQTQGVAHREADHLLLVADGSTKWVVTSGDAVSSCDTPVVAGVIRDLTPDRLQEHEVLRLARYDSLTHLPNRSQLHDHLAEALARSEASGKPGAVLFIDLDGFKQVNDTLGHAAGDELLVEVAERFRKSVQGSGFVARFGGDEFILVLENLPDAAGAERFSTMLLRLFEQPFALGGRERLVTASIGTSIFPADGTDAMTLLRNADTAMYRAKNAGRNAFRVFTRDMHAAAAERFAVELDLREAIALGDFELHFQPIVRVDGEPLFDVEALLRWRATDGTPISPAVFIPIAEETGMMPAIGAWVINEALAQVRRWRDSGMVMRVGVNISMCELQDPLFVDRIERALHRHNVNAESLVLEITETAAMADLLATCACLNRCKELGVHIAIDDFLTHYSTLAYLQQLPVSVIKVDRAFVAELPDNHANAAIVEAVMSISKAMNFAVVAEGVETAAQLKWLSEHGCNFVQGYFIARPMTASQVEDWYAGKAHRFS